MFYKAQWIGNAGVRINDDICFSSSNLLLLSKYIDIFMIKESRTERCGARAGGW
jgi:hypothetical protein